jgi:hypothetical protein
LLENNFQNFICIFSFETLSPYYVKREERREREKGREREREREGEGGRVVCKKDFDMLRAKIHPD